MSRRMIWFPTIAIAIGLLLGSFGVVWWAFGWIGVILVVVVFLSGIIG